VYGLAVVVVVVYWGLWFIGILGDADAIGVWPLMSVVCDVPGVNSGGMI